MNVTVTIPPELLDALKAELRDELLAELGAERDNSWPAFMSMETASRYLDVPVERLRKLKTAMRFRSTRRASAAACFSGAATSTTGCTSFDTRDGREAMPFS